MKPREAAASLEQLKKDLNSGELKRCYLLFGSERYLRNFYEKKLLTAMGGSRDDMNTNVFDTSPIQASAIIDAAQTLPFFADRRVVLIRYSGFFKKGGEELADFLAEAPETTSFIFVEDDADARLKLYKQIAKLGRVVEFVTQSDKYLLQNIGAFLKRADKRMSQEDAAYLLDVIGTDMGKLMSELEKLVSFTGDREVVTKSDIDVICSRNIDDRVFEMIDAVMRHDVATCMDCCEDLIALKTAPAMIVIMLEKQFLWMLQLKSLAEDDNLHTIDIINTIAYKQEVDTETGEIKRSRGSIGEFQVRKYLQQAEHMNKAELQRAVKLCSKADEDFKSGKMNERIAMETLLVNLCRVEKNA